jgi:hypothetical protein
MRARRLLFTVAVISASLSLAVPSSSLASSYDQMKESLGDYSTPAPLPILTKSSLCRGLLTTAYFWAGTWLGTWAVISTSHFKSVNPGDDYLFSAVSSVLLGIFQTAATPQDHRALAEKTAQLSPDDPRTEMRLLVSTIELWRNNQHNPYLKDLIAHVKSETHGPGRSIGGNLIADLLLVWAEDIQLSDEEMKAPRKAFVEWAAEQVLAGRI